MNAESITYDPHHSTMTLTPGKRYAYYALAVLTLLNLLNYVDRYIFAALIPYIKDDTGFTDAQLGLIGSAFTYVYTVCSPLFGYLGDRYRRGRLIGAGIVVWSLATAGAGLARNFVQLLVSRSAVGVGEANYATIAPGLLSDFFVKTRRGMVMSIFFATIPIGTAIGFGVGGILGAPEYLGWRHTLYLVGLPGLLTAAAAWMMAEPERGAMDADEAKTATPGFVAGYTVLLRNRGYMFGCLGYAAVTFAVGALVFWAPEWLKTDKSISAQEANVILGACVVGGGLLGTLVGGVIGDRLIKRGVRGAYFWVCGGGAILAAPFCLAMLMTTNVYVYAGSIFVGVTLVLSGNGPVNALLVNMVPSNLRTTALGFAVVTIHLLGDGLSVSLVGMISTWIQNSRTAMPGVVTALGHVFHINPDAQSLSMALLVMPLSLVVGGLLYFVGARTTEGQLT
jgi:MFS transporter, Spinster family, sphingosine-1-phosphate transporter